MRSRTGKSWLEFLMTTMAAQTLNKIDSKLTELEKTSILVPSKEEALRPLHMIHPRDVKLVMICKEPYPSRTMATGIPIETANDMITPTMSIFMEFISRFYTEVDSKNFMCLYYYSGVLVINVAFTICEQKNKKFSYSESHVPLWSEFVHQLVVIFNSMRVPILALGSEGRAILRDISPSDNNLYQCVFPTGEKNTKKEFFDTLDSLFFDYLFHRA